MGGAAPSYIGIVTALDTPLEGSATLMASNDTRKRITVLVLFILWQRTFFFATLPNDLLGCFKHVFGDDSFVVVFHPVFIFLAMVMMAIKMRIGIGFLENSIPSVILVFQYAANGCCSPMGTAFSRNFLCI